MVDQLSYFLFQPVLHYWYDKGSDMSYSVYGIVHIKDLLLLIGKSTQGSASSVVFLAICVVL